MTEAEWLTSADPERMLEYVRDIMEAGNPPHVSKPVARKLRLFAVACWRASGKFPKSAAMYAAVEAEATEYEGGILNPVTLATAWAGTEDPVRTAALLRDVFGNPFQPSPLGNDGDGFFYGAMQRNENNLSWPELFRLTPAVLALAQAAYDERAAQECTDCDGRGTRGRCKYPSCSARRGTWNKTGECPSCGWLLVMEACFACHGTGAVSDGTLDPARLAVLAEALEEAGCMESSLLNHLRSKCPACTDKTGFQWGKVANCHNCGGTGESGPHYRGCWVVDAILGKE